MSNGGVSPEKRQRRPQTMAASSTSTVAMPTAAGRGVTHPRVGDGERQHDRGQHSYGDPSHGPQGPGHRPQRWLTPGRREATAIPASVARHSAPATSAAYLCSLDPQSTPRRQR